MAKRFTDTELWKKGWFMQLPSRLKLLWQYLTVDCDPAGVWEPNFELASLFVGEAVSESDLKKYGDRVEKLPNGKFWLTTFIDFQYSGHISEKSPAHKKIFQSLHKNKIFDRVFTRVVDRVVTTLQEEHKEKEEVKDKDFGKSENLYKRQEQSAALGEITYNAEATILENMIEFERICMKARLTDPVARDSLRTYHLYLTEKEQYPKGRRAVFAGFEKWAMNEKKFNNGTVKKSSSGGRGQAGLNHAINDLQHDIQTTASRTRDA